MGWLFPGADGTYTIQNFLNQRLWSPFSLGFFADPLQGLGDIEFPLNTWLTPGYALPALILGPETANSGAFHVLSHTVFAVELYAATFCLSRALGIGVGAGLGAAWLTPLLVMPYFGEPLLYPSLLYSPHRGTLIAECALALAGIATLAQQDFRTTLIRTVVLTAAVYALLAHSMLMSPVTIILSAPVVAIGVLGLAAGAERGMRIQAIVIAATIATLLAASGFAIFVLAIFKYTVPHLLGNAVVLLPQLQDWEHVSNWFYAPVAGKTLIAAAVYGLVFAFMFGHRQLRFFALALASIMFVIFGSAAITVGTDSWRLPVLVYYEMLVVPFYLVFAAFGITATFACLYGFALRYGVRSITDRKRNFFATAIPYALIVPAIALFAMRHVHNTDRVAYPLPPIERPLVSLLKEEIALNPGGPFRGRAISMVPLEKRAVSWLEVAGRNEARTVATGNDYYWSGLWPNRIPTLFEYSAQMSPAFFLAAVRLLGVSGDRQIRNVIVLRRPDARLLALFGVRYVIADAPLPHPFRLKTSDKTFGAEILNLYEIPNVNLGTYSPVTLMQARSFDEALDRLLEPSFDGTKAVVLTEPLPGKYDGPLVAARKAVLKVDRGALSIQADSAGTSILVLPFQFSRCYKLELAQPTQPIPELLQVNAALMGIVFRGHLDARAAYFTGPFSAPGCRLKDKDDFVRLLRPDR